MKQLLFCVLACCLHILSPAQTTIPLDSFYIPGTTWTEVVNEDLFPCSTGHDLWTKGIVYKVERDSTISGKTYHLLSSCNKGGYSSYVDCGTGTYSYSNDRGSCGSPATVFAMIRTDSNRVYFTLLTPQHSGAGYNCDTVGHEYLFYDFNLSAGSVIPYSTLGSGITVSAIDSVALSNGAYVKRYNGALLYGIGAQDGFIKYWNLYTCGPGPSATQYLLCYDNPSFSYHFVYPAGTLPGNLQNNCFDIDPYIDSVTAVITYVAPAPALKIYPNPATSTLNIANIEPITSIIISAPTGQVLYNSTSNAKEVQVDISALPTGIYFIQVNRAGVNRFAKE